MKHKNKLEETSERDTSINEDDSVTVTKEGSTIQVYQDPIYRGSIREKARKPGHWYISNIEATGNTAEEFKKNLKEAKKITLELREEAFENDDWKRDYYREQNQDKT